MTAQISEIVTYQDRQYTLLCTPLASYLNLPGKGKPFRVESTALWRGYVGKWHVEDNRLYLVAIQGTFQDGSRASLAGLFPDLATSASAKDGSRPTRIFADWFTGTLRLADGELVNYVHGGFASSFAREIFMELEHGVVLKTWTQQNDGRYFKPIPR
jgi:hypothetical protein